MHDMTDPSFAFTNAVTRRPGRSVIRGLRAVDTGPPSLLRMQRAHDAYVAALRAAGVRVTVLDPLEAHPDALFVEDTALCLPQGAVLMRPGAPSRRGEVAAMAPVLRDFYGELHEIAGPGTVEGGDILFTGREVLAGRSARTDTAGLTELSDILAGWGLKLREVATPPGVLHFKTDCSLLDAETILSTRRLDATGCFAGYRVLHVPAGEEAAANTIRVNGVVIVPAGFARTARMLESQGYRVVPVDNRDGARLDGGMSCLSLRLSI